MSRAVGAHRFAEGHEEGLLAEAREEPDALQLVLDRILYLGETQLDASSVQSVVELAQASFYAGHILPVAVVPYLQAMKGKKICL